MSRLVLKGGKKSIVVEQVRGAWDRIVTAEMEKGGHN